MSKKYFGYSFQVKRTKVGASILIVVVALAVGAFYLWYNKQTVTVKVADLSFKEVFGLNKFSSSECARSYRVNYKKDTCGTICIKKEKKNSSYFDEFRKSMKENGFEFYSVSSQKLGNKKWEYLKVKNNKPIMNYYKIDNRNYTYVIEYIDQSYALNKSNKDECSKIRSKFNESIRINS